MARESVFFRSTTCLDPAARTQRHTIMNTNTAREARKRLQMLTFLLDESASKMRASNDRHTSVEVQPNRSDTAPKDSLPETPDTCLLALPTRMRSRSTATPISKHNVEVQEGGDGFAVMAARGAAAVVPAPPSSTALQRLQFRKTTLRPRGPCRQYQERRLLSREG